ncbi:integrase, catalytic region, zinc finger, CCHC-type containing protein [Tanacetum coccineum]
MTTLADKAILSGVDNRPPMLEKDMYDSWKSRMELYMMNRQHGRMILEFIENGPLIWPSIEENGVTRPTKYSELSPTEAIQADCDVKATNIILQGLPPKVYALFLNTLPPDWSKFVTDVKLVWDLHTTNIDQLHAYLGQHEFHANEGRQTSLAAGTLRTYTPRASGSNFGKQRTVICYNCKGEGHMSKQCTKPKKKQDDSWFKDKVLLVQAQASVITHNAAYQADDLDAYDSDNVNNDMTNQVVQVMPSSEQSNVVNHSETEITSDSNIIPYSQYLIESQQIALEPKLYVGDIIEKTNPIVIPDSKETLTLAEESRSKMLLKHKDNTMLEKQVDTTPVDYAALNQLYKAFETRFVPQTELSAKQAFWSKNYVNSSEPTLSIRPINVEVPKEHPKVSMVNTSMKKLKHHLANFDMEKVLVITALKDDLRKLKGKALVDNDVTKNPSDLEMLKIDVEPITSKLLNKRTSHSAYIKHTQEEAAVLRDLVDHIKANYPLDHTLDSACRYTDTFLAY